MWFYLIVKLYNFHYKPDRNWSFFNKKLKHFQRIISEQLHQLYQLNQLHLNHPLICVINNRIKYENDEIFTTNLSSNARKIFVFKSLWNLLHSHLHPHRLQCQIANCYALTQLLESLSRSKSSSTAKNGTYIDQGFCVFLFLISVGKSSIFAVTGGTYYTRHYRKKNAAVSHVVQDEPPVINFIFIEPQFATFSKTAIKTVMKSKIRCKKNI